MLLTILIKELRSAFNNLTAYTTIAFFLLFSGLWVWVLPITNIFEQGEATMESFFKLAPYILMIVAPALSMSSITNEKKEQTLGLLLSSPLCLKQIIWGKYLALLCILFIAILPTMTYVYTIYHLSEPLGNIDLASILTSYISLLLLGAAFLAIGLLTSALTNSQMIAFLSSSCISFCMFQLFDSWATLHSWRSYSFILTRLGMLQHYYSLSRGLIDFRDIVYFLTIIFVSLATTQLVLRYKR